MKVWMLLQIFSEIMLLAPAKAKRRCERCNSRDVVIGGDEGAVWPPDQSAAFRRLWNACHEVTWWTGCQSM
jgi:hypothetical protein